MAKTVGTGILNLKAFVAERLPAGAWERVLAALPAGDAEQLKSATAVGWYDLALFRRLLRAIDQVGGAGDLALMPRLGAYEAERDLNGFFRFILKVANPAYTIEQAGRLWRKFQDSGSLTVERQSATHCIGTLADWGVVDEALCIEVGWYMARSLELVGAKALVFQHPECRAKGAAVCRFDFRWE